MASDAIGPRRSIVIPAFNEAARIGAAVAAGHAWLRANARDGELIVVDDGSSDGTAQIAEAGGARVLRLGRNRGKGAAVRAGVLAARGERVLFCDADLSTPITAWPVLDALHASGAAVAVGIRTHASVSRGQPLARRLLGRCGRVVIRWLVPTGVQDTQCGFKSFERDAARAVFEQARIDRFGFDVELLMLARHLGLSVAEAAVPWANDPRSTVRPIRDGLRTLCEVVRIRWRLWRAPPPSASGPSQRSRRAVIGSDHSPDQE